MTIADDFPLEKRTPGRPRSAQTRAAILDAALTLFDTVPYRDISIDRIAAAAKVGKQSIYRWWPSKADLLLDAHLERLAVQSQALRRSGNALADLEALLKQTYLVLDGGPARQGLRFLIAEAQFDDAFSKRLHDLFFQRSRDALTAILNDGRARGQLRSGVDFDALIDVITGAMWYRLLSCAEPASSISYAEVVIDMVRALVATDPSDVRPATRDAALFEA